MAIESAPNPAARPDEPHSPPGPAPSPLRERVFRALWLAQFASNIGTWMQTVGAQWLLLGHGASLVALVQVAASLPVVLLALPSGALADLTDRRRLLLTAQIAMAVLAGVLAVLAFAGRATPAVLLGVTFLLGCGTAMAGPSWQAIQPSLVARSQLRQAAALGAVSMNLARAVGPALGGVLVSLAGVGWTFALNALSFVAITVVLLRWRPATPPSPSRVQEREQVAAALRAGTRYVRHAPGVRRILLRSLLFVPAAAALWALLPVFASSSLHLGSGGYGLLLGAVGLGAVAGAVLLPRLGDRVPGTVVLAVSGGMFGLAMTVMVLLPVTAVAVLALVLAGMGWIGALSTLSASIQLLLPPWVRARGLAFYLLVFQGGQALGALVWGLAAQAWGLSAALLAAAALLLAGAASAAVWPLHELAAPPGVDQRGWPEPVFEAEPAPGDGPVLVLVEYRLKPDAEAAFTGAMEQVERTRRRTGAVSWGLYRDSADPLRFIETFTVSSWSEHLAQHHDRYSGLDRAFEAASRELLSDEPRVTHALAPGH